MRALRKRAEATFAIADVQARAEVGGQRQRVLASDAPAWDATPHAREARADDHVGVTVEHRLDQAVDVCRIVLTVAVEQHQRIGMDRARMLERGLDGRGLAFVARVAQDGRARGFGDHRGGIGRAVVDDEHEAALFAQLEHQAADEAVLVVGRNGHQHDLAAGRGGRVRLRGASLPR